MSGYGAKEARQREPRKRINLCGACGGAISESELLCADCIAEVCTDSQDGKATDCNPVTREFESPSVLQ